MKRLFPHIALTALIVAVVAGCSGRARIIPKDTLARIYADMFLADQWIEANSNERRTADTTLFYEDIFNSYGYTFEDYNASVDKYMYDPDNFSKILKQSTEILTVRRNGLQAIQDRLDLFASFKPRKKADISFGKLEKQDTLFKYWFYGRRRADSLRLDSLRLDSLRLDSLRLDFLRLDSLRLDSLRRDSLRLDSLRRDSLRPGGRKSARKPKTLLRKPDRTAGAKAGEALEVQPLK